MFPKLTRMRAVIVVAFMLMHFIPLAQNKRVDSLRLVFNNAQTDENKFAALSHIRAYYSEDNLDSSLYYSYQMLALAEKNGAIRLRCYALSTLGHTLGTGGNYNEALKRLLESKQLAEDNNVEPDLIQASYHLLGNLYFSHDNMSDAKQHFLKAWAMNLPERDPHIFTYASVSYTTAMNLCAVYTNLGMFDSALHYGQRAHEQGLKQHQLYMPVVLRNLGATHAALGNDLLAYSYYMQSIKKLKENGSSSRQLANTYVSLSRYFDQQGKRDSAFHYGRMAIQTVGNTGFHAAKVLATKHMSDLYASNSDSCLKFMRQWATLRDSMVNFEKYLQFQSIRYQDNIREQKKAEELIISEKRRKANIQYAGILGSVIFLMMLYMLLTNSIIVNEKVIRFFGIVLLLIVFEFINLLLHPYIARITDHSPAGMLIFMVAVAAILIPLHHRLEHWISTRLVEKNKRVRLIAAKKTIRELEHHT